MNDSVLNDCLSLISGEHERLAAVSDCLLYFRALAETRRQETVSILFEGLPPDLPKDCDEETARRIHEVLIDFIEKCRHHPSIAMAFHTLVDLNVDPDLPKYLISKLRLYHAQGDAHTVYNLCILLENLRMEVFLDEKGERINSMCLFEGEKNLGVARRFLARLNPQKPNQKKA